VIWITRAQPGAERTASRVRALGLGALLAPLLEVRQIGPGEIDLAGVAALAFTSANGVAAFAARGLGRDLPVFTVGAGTAAAARAAGFDEVAEGRGDVADLALMIAGLPVARAGEILHCGAAEPAGDLVGDLKRHGLRARAVALYETVETAAPLPPLKDLAAVLLHSPKAARVLAGRLGSAGAPGLRAICLSEAVAGPIAGLPFASIAVADEPTEAALLLALDASLRRGPD